MTIGAVLLAYAVGVGTLSARALGRARWTSRAPQLAIYTYLTAVWSTLAAVGLAGLTLAVHTSTLGGGLSDLIGACVIRLRDMYATPGGAAAAGLGLTLTGAVLARTAFVTVTHVRAARQQTRRHTETARMVGRPDPALGATLLEHPQPAAYCVGGRPPTVVLTTAALAALEPAQLDAVLAHERAHLAGHHHQLMTMARIARAVLPFLPLMRDAEAQVARLAELHADDMALRSREPGLLATALVVLATPAAPAPSPTPAPVLAAAATDAIGRIHRMLGPAEPPLGPVRRHLLHGVVAALALTPILLALAPAGIALVLGHVPGA